MKFDPYFLPRVGLAMLCAAAISLALTPLVKVLAKKVGAMDVPKDDRRMHHTPIPRMGGLAIFLGFLVSVLIFQTVKYIGAGIENIALDEQKQMQNQVQGQMQGILLGAVIIVVLGVVDDIMALPALPKFLVQIVAAVIVVVYGCRIERFMGWTLPVWLSYPISVIWIVAITNAVNFIDGLDGLAAGVSAISAGTMLIVALLLVPADASSVCAIMLAALVGACIGFIPYNFNPATIFMGDTGSTFLGFMLASISIFGLFKTYAVISFAVPFLLLGLPIFDICFAVIRRVAHGQSPMHADRGHVHHRLIDMGFSQKQAVAISYLLSAILGLSAVVLTDRGEVQAMIFLIAIIVVGAIGVGVIFGTHHTKKHGAEQQEAHPAQEAKSGAAWEAPVAQTYVPAAQKSDAAVPAQEAPQEDE